MNRKAYESVTKDITKEGDLRLEIKYFSNIDGLNLLWDFDLHTEVKAIAHDDEIISVLKVKNVQAQTPVGAGTTVDVDSAQIEQLQVINKFSTLQRITIPLIIKFKTIKGKTHIPAGWASMTRGGELGLGAVFVEGSYNQSWQYNYERNETHDLKEVPNTFRAKVSFDVKLDVATDEALLKNVKEVKINANIGDLNFDVFPAIAPHQYSNFCYIYS